MITLFSSDQAAGFSPAVFNILNKRYLPTEELPQWMKTAESEPSVELPDISDFEFLRLVDVDGCGHCPAAYRMYRHKSVDECKERYQMAEQLWSRPQMDCPYHGAQCCQAKFDAWSGKLLPGQFRSAVLYLKRDIQPDELDDLYDRLIALARTVHSKNKLKIVLHAIKGSWRLHLGLQNATADLDDIWEEYFQALVCSSSVRERMLACYACEGIPAVFSEDGRMVFRGSPPRCLFFGIVQLGDYQDDPPGWLAMVARPGVGFAGYAAIPDGYKLSRGFRGPDVGSKRTQRTERPVKQLPKLTKVERAIYELFSRQAKKGLVKKFSIQGIAKQVGCSARGVQRALKILNLKLLIRTIPPKVKKDGCNYRSVGCNTYQILP